MIIIMFMIGEMTQQLINHMNKTIDRLELKIQRIIIFHILLRHLYGSIQLLYNIIIRIQIKGEIYNYISPPETDWLADVAHEKDYQSQDLDFQPQSFETQHFRKKGPIYMWLFVGALPLLFFGNELFYQGWSDDDQWRYQRAPPLMYPDEDDTPDPQDFLIFQTPQYNDWWDAGVLKRPYFTIQDGKKIYFKHAGVNQPVEIPELS